MVLLIVLRMIARLLSWALLNFICIFYGAFILPCIAEFFHAYFFFIGEQTNFTLYFYLLLHLLIPHATTCGRQTTTSES